MPRLRGRRLSLIRELGRVAVKAKEYGVVTMSTPSDAGVRETRGPMIGGGSVPCAAVRTIIRHSVGAGSARVVFVSREDGWPGDILIPESGDGAFMDRLYEAVQKALGYIRGTAGSLLSHWGKTFSVSQALDDPTPRPSLANLMAPAPGVEDKIADLMADIDIVAVAPLAAGLAGRAVELIAVLEGKDHAAWAEFVAGLARPDAALEWDALGVARRIYEKECRAEYVGGNEPRRRQARRILHVILKALLRSGDVTPDFAAAAAPMTMSCCLALLTADEKKGVDDTLLAVERGESPPPVDFGAFAFTREEDYSPAAVAALTARVSPALKAKWLQLVAGKAAPPPAAADPDEGPEDFFLYFDAGTAGGAGWQVSRPSVNRKTIYVTHDLARDLADHPFALAELLIEEVGAHLDPDRRGMTLAGQEAFGWRLRQELLIEHKRKDEGIVTLRDLLPEVADDPTLDVPWTTAAIATRHAEDARREQDDARVQKLLARIARHDEAAIREAGDQRERRAVPALIEELKNAFADKGDFQQSRRADVRIALAKIRDPRSFPHLLPVLWDMDLFLHRWQFSSLPDLVKSHRENPSDESKDYRPEVYRRTWEALFALQPDWPKSEHGERALPHLVDVLKRHYAPDLMQLQTLKLVAMIGRREAVPGVIACMNWGGGFFRAAAAGTLGEFGAAEAIPALLEALDGRKYGDDIQIYGPIADSLGQILAADAAHVSAADLRQLSQAPDRTGAVFVGLEWGEGASSYDVYEDRPVDFSRVRELASQELTARGIDLAAKPSSTPGKLEVACPHCGKAGRVAPEWLGRTIRCPKCKQEFVAGPAAAES